MTDAALVGLAVADPPERWAALGFHVRDGRVKAHSVILTLGIAPQGGGIVGWTLAGSECAGDVGGLPTRWERPGSATYRRAPSAGRGIRSLDHVVVATPVFDALAAELDDRRMALRRITEIRGTRMGFRRLGGPILEVVEAPEAEVTAFWGLTFVMRGPPGTTESLDELCARNRFVGDPQPAVQPGRRIATVSGEAGLSTRVAFIDPEPRR